jgi:hypothetical protein
MKEVVRGARRWSGRSCVLGAVSGAFTRRSRGAGYAVVMPIRNAGSDGAPARNTHAGRFGEVVEVRKLSGPVGRRSDVAREVSATRAGAGGVIALERVRVRGEGTS